MKTITGMLAFTTFACLLTASAGPAAVFAQAVEPDLAIWFSSARTVFVVGFAGRQMMDRLWANPDGARAEIKVKAVLSEWGKYEIVEDPRTADLVLVVIESQKNLNLFRLANLVAELKVYRGGQNISVDTPTLWSGEAAENFKKLPATKVAEKFRDYVMKVTRP